MIYEFQKKIPLGLEKYNQVRRALSEAGRERGVILGKDLNSEASYVYNLLKKEYDNDLKKIISEAIQYAVEEFMADKLGVDVEGGEGNVKEFDYWDIRDMVYVECKENDKVFIRNEAIDLDDVNFIFSSFENEGGIEVRKKLDDFRKQLRDISKDAGGIEKSGIRFRIWREGEGKRTVIIEAYGVAGVPAGEREGRVTDPTPDAPPPTDEPPIELPVPEQPILSDEQFRIKAIQEEMDKLREDLKNNLIDKDVFVILYKDLSSKL